MTSDNQNKIILLLSLPIAILATIVSYAGLFIPDTYAKETANWAAQAVAQDIIDLFLIIPFLLITSWLAFKKSRIALLLWSGVLIYLIYTFVIYCFAVHFNQLFIVYCLVLGLSFYAFLYFFLSQIKEPIDSWFSDTVPVKTVGIYLMILSGLFYLLWLSEIIPAIFSNTTPATIIETGLVTNPVHALDLSVVLPGFMIVGILLLKKNPKGLLLAPAVLTFCILMDITIGTLMIVMDIRGIETDLSLTVIMVLLALFTLGLLIWFLKSLQLKRIGT
ncbi:MAG: hypothetical protein KAV45_08905 [Calditrichia bacterium]|nr:hypothetical protein [Calditrichia bacterium]